MYFPIGAWNAIAKIVCCLVCVGLKNRYNLSMDRKQALDAVNDRAILRLTRFDPPAIILCGRLTRTAGKCYQTARKIHLGWKFIDHSVKFRHIMFNEILPHELMHQVDYDLFGESEKICGHGKNWQMLMVQYGLEPKKYHLMDLKAK